MPEVQRPDQPRVSEDPVRRVDVGRLHLRPQLRRARVADVAQALSLPRPDSSGRFGLLHAQPPAESLRHTVSSFPRRLRIYSVRRVPL